MEFIFHLFAFTVFAAELVISPLPDHREGVPMAAQSTKPTVSFDQLSHSMTARVVLGEHTSSLPSQEASPTPTTTPSPTPTSIPHYTKKSSLTVALIGDSMIDTLGPGVPQLQHLLSDYYPSTSFRILNYGYGGTNIDYGLTRLTNDHTYLGNHIPALVSEKPDLVVVESFGYNPYPTDDGYLNRHWMTLARMVDAIHATLPQSNIVIAATIAPNWDTFGDGVAGLAFDPQSKRDKVTRIKQYLENAIKFAQSQHLPLADSFHDSLDKNGNGKLVYINSDDHIHYSEAGRALFATKIFDTITTNRLLE